MEHVRCVEAIGFVRRLRGGSQPVLLEANDGSQYVVKFQNNFQGPHLLFNEAMGTKIFELAGLPVPEWRAVRVTENFLARNPGCWMETGHGLVKPQAGLCFGSRSLESQGTRIFEILAGGYFTRVRNRRHFWTAWVLDALAEHTDNRQALFIESASRWLDAWFVDHGHLLGGALGTKTPYYQASRYIDARIYTGATAEDAQEAENAVRGIDPLVLAETAQELPPEWKTSSSNVRLGRFLERIGDPGLVRGTAGLVLGLNRNSEIHGLHDERRTTHFRLHCENSGLCAQVSESGGESLSGGRWAVDSVRRPGPLGPLAVHPVLLQAANF